MKTFLSLSLFLLFLISKLHESWGLFEAKHLTEIAEIGGGLKLQLTNKGLKALAHVIAATSKKALIFVPVSDYVHPVGDGGVKIKLLELELPNIEAKFKAATGIDINMHIPKIDALTNFKFGDLPNPVNVTSELKEVFSKILLKVKPGDFNQPTLDVSFCSSDVKSIEPKHDDGDIKEKLRGLADKAFKKTLPDSICNGVKTFAASINSAFFNFDPHSLPKLSNIIPGGKLPALPKPLLPDLSGGLPKPHLPDLSGGLSKLQLPNITSSSGKFHLPDMNEVGGIPQLPDMSDGLPGFPKPNLTLFCGAVSRVHEAHHSGKLVGVKSFVSYLSTQLKGVTDEIPGMKFKTSMQKEAQYSDTDMKVDMNAGFEVEDDETVQSFNLPTFKPIAMLTLPSLGPKKSGNSGGGQAAPFTQVPAADSSHDLCLSLEDKVVNSFFKLGQQHRFFNTTLNVTKDDIPEPVWNLMKLAFKGDFMMVLDLDTIEAPAFHFDEKGGHMTAKITAQFGIQTGWHHGAEKLVEASVNMDVAVKQYIDQHAIKASISLGPAPKITVHHIFLTGLVDNIASDLINILVSKVVWPHVQHKFNQMLGVGIRLPTPCGLSFADPKIVNVPGEVKLCSNINYDATGFLARLKQHADDKKKGILSDVTGKPVVTTATSARPATTTHGPGTTKPGPVMTTHIITTITTTPQKTTTTTHGPTTTTEQPERIFRIGDVLVPGQQIKSRLGRCILMNAASGYHIIQHGPTKFAIWASRTPQLAGQNIAFTADGLSVGNGKAVFGLKQPGFSLHKAELWDDDCGLHMEYRNSAGERHHFTLGNLGEASVKKTGLLPTEAVFSRNMKFMFCNQLDGNLVLYRLNDNGQLGSAIISAKYNGPTCVVEEDHNNVNLVRCLNIELTDRMAAKPNKIVLDNDGNLRFTDEQGSLYMYKNLRA